jgi:CRP-like cAMP-binding protein
MKLERQMAWPCHECTVRGSNFCSTFIDKPPRPRSTRERISQVFLSAAKHEVIHHDGDGTSPGPFVLCNGWAYRFHQFPDGRRQILSVLIPGDLFSTFALLEPNPDFSVRAATDIQLCQLRRDDFRSEITSEPGLRDAFAKLCSAEVNDASAALVNLNECDPVRRVVGFVRQIIKRLLARNIVNGAGIYQFPLDHADIADATALAPDDVSSAMANLRENRIIDIADGLLTVLDAAKLGEAAQINK